LLSWADDPASNKPKTSSTTGPTDEPNTVQPTTPALRAERGR